MYVYVFHAVKEISWAIFIGRPVHHAIHAVKCIPPPGGGEEFLRIPLFFALRRHTPLFPAHTNTRVCIPARCFTKCTHCTGFNHPLGGRTSSFGAASRDNAARFFTRRHEKKRKRQETWSSAETPRRMGYNYHSMLGSSQSATVPPRLFQRSFA